MVNRKIFRFFIVFALAIGFAMVPATTSAQSGGVKGKVRNQRGQGIANTTVTARQDGQEIKSVRSDSKGDFVLSGLRPGTYNIAFDAPGYATGVKFGVRVEGKTINLGDRLILAVDQGTQVIVRGSIFFREGTSIPGAKVELYDVTSASPRRLATAYTNVSGDFTFRQPEGASKYKIVASYKGSKGEKEIVIEGAAIYRAAITLDISRPAND